MLTPAPLQGFFVPYLVGGISIAVLAIGSTAPGLLQYAINQFSQVPYLLPPRGSFTICFPLPALSLCPSLLFCVGPKLPLFTTKKERLKAAVLTGRSTPTTASDAPVMRLPTSLWGTFSVSPSQATAWTWAECTQTLPRCVTQISFCLGFGGKSSHPPPLPITCISSPVLVPLRHLSIAAIALISVPHLFPAPHLLPSWSPAYSGTLLVKPFLLLRPSLTPQHALSALR